MEKKRQIEVKVCDAPPTYILIDEDRDPAEVIATWRKRYNMGRVELSEEQQRRERESVRAGKVTQRKNFKR
jgi:hypothetical protein